MSTKRTEWKPGNAVAWRGIYRNKVWHAQTVLVVKDTPEEIAMVLLPGAACVAPEGYLDGKDSTKRRWGFKDKDWELQDYLWRTNRLLILLEPEKYYSTMYFWDDDSNEFLCYYINFQLPSSAAIAELTRWTWIWISSSTRISATSGKMKMITKRQLITE